MSAKTIQDHREGGPECLWSIGESNPCSATDIGATAHRADRFLSVEAGADEISSTGGRQRQPLANAIHAKLKSGNDNS